MRQPLEPGSPAENLVARATHRPQPYRQPAGTSLEYTETLRRALPGLLEKYRVDLLLDGASGRFSWLGHVDLTRINYIGIDKSAEVVASNQAMHGGQQRRFLQGDIITEPLPPADMLMCRELLNVLPYSEIYEFFNNFVKSSIPLVLMTSHRLWNNKDSHTGKWRQLNLTRPPFSLPGPIEVLEDSKEGYPSRYLGLWSREQVQEALEMARLGFGGREAPDMSSKEKPKTTPQFKEFPRVAQSDVASKQVDLVTVVYAPEVSLLQLQARSIARNLDSKNLNKIHIIVNELEPAAVVDKIKSFIPEEYGPLKDRVKIWTAADLSATDSTRGWRTQQTLKLRIADHIESPKYMIFDAKNHIVKKCRLDDFFAPDGRPRSFWTVQAGSLKNYLINSLAYFDLPEAVSTSKVMPATTPYILYTHAVRNMMSMIEDAESMSFEKFFHTPGRDVTEFFLYFSYMLHQKEELDKLYRFGGRFAVTLFTRWPDTAEQQAAALERLANPAIFVFGLHKNRVANLDEAARGTVRKTWIDAGLFPDDAGAQKFYDNLLADIGADATKQPSN